MYMQICQDALALAELFEQTKQAVIAHRHVRKRNTEGVVVMALRDSKRDLTASEEPIVNATCFKCLEKVSVTMAREHHSDIGCLSTLH